MSKPSGVSLRLVACTRHGFSLTQSTMLITCQKASLTREPRSAHRGRLRRLVPAVLLVIAAGCAGHIHPSPQPAAPLPESLSEAPAGKQVTFTATAYCSGSRTASGTRVTEGIAAADPSLVPIGSVIRVSGLERRYNGIYTVMDTGSKIRGRRLDLYVRDCSAATRFGKRSARVSIMRRGWHPRTSAATG